MTLDGLSPAVVWNFQEAARVVRERTRIDRDRADCDGAKRLLEAIENEMFESGFQVATPRPSRATLAWFRKMRGITPYGYLVVRRVEVGIFLLDFTEAEVPTIARLLGYGSARSFSSAFKRWMSYAPSEERRRWRAGLVEVEPPAVPGPRVRRIVVEAGDYRREAAPTLRRALAGALPLETVAGILDLLRADGKEMEFAAWVISHRDETVEDLGDELPARAAAAAPTPAMEEVALRDAAVRSTLDVLGHYEPELPRRLGPVLEGLKARFVDLGFSVAGLKNELLVDNMDLSWFSRTVGAPAGQYVIEGRMEVSARLLGTSSLSMPALALLVGYSDPQQFRRMFKRWSGGLTPSEFRDRMRVVAERAGEVPAEYVHWRFLEGLPFADREVRLAWVRFLEKVYRL